MNFWKIFGATAAACGSCMVVIIGIFILFGTSYLSMFDMDIEEEVVEPQTVLCIDFAEDIIDAPLVSPLGYIDPLTMEISQPLPLIQAISAIDNAAHDSNIKGICIRLNGMGVVDATTIEELRRTIERFKLSGKFVVAYDDYYTQSEYYLASVADHIILQKEGSIEWQGIGFNIMFYKSLLDKIDASVEVFKPTGCKYKSGAEPFVLTAMSKDNREQMNSLANSMWETIVNAVAQSRNIDSNKLKSWAQNLNICYAQEALEANLIDEIGYEDAMIKYFTNHGVAYNDINNINMISLGRYSAIVNSNWQYIPFVEGSDNYATPSDKPLVAVVYANGEIMDGNMLVDNYVHGSMLAAQLRQLRLDDNTKAVVLRVNSPGGSSLASEVIWHEMMLLQKSKPVIVSMGSTAASGGYYISVPADYIFTNQLTMTGSIGVYGVMFNFENTLKNHLGITFDSAGSSPMANGITMVAPLTSRQKEIIMEGVDSVYTTFTDHVAKGRNMSIDRVYSLAEGRIWSGSDAVANGLADNIGGLSEAIYKAASEADIEDNFVIYEFGYSLTPLDEFLYSATGLFAKSWGLNPAIYEEQIFNIVKYNPFIFTNSGIQCIMPGNIRVNL